ncbi:MAG: hypothetical protein HDQ95_09190 [Roseburia sp.]|nr:hypothetical protein [Roseburia sp.]
MILDTLKATNSVMLDSIQVTNNKYAAKTFKEQVIALGLCAPTLEQLLNVITALKNKQIAPEILTAELKETLQMTVDNCGEKTNDHTLDATTVQALKNAIDLCKTATESAWRDAADKHCTTVIDSLTSLKSLLPDKKEADDLLEALGNAKIKMPTSAKGIDEFLSKVIRGKEIVDGLHLDDEVEKFINKVKLQKATVSDLTPHVLEWLKANDLMNTMKVRF